MTLSREAFRLLASEGADRALVLFVPEEDPAHYRFSLIEMKLGWEDESAKIRRTYSNPRRFSYLLGRGTACHTPNEYLRDKGRVRDIDDLRSRFSVEALTKQFYGELFAWYEWAKEPASGVTFPNLVTTPDDDRDSLDVKLIRLITRLIFVWFIKQKQLVPGELFDEASLQKVLKGFDPNSRTSGTYYNAVLQNLFFATLNRAIAGEGGRGFAKRVGKTDLKTLYRYSELFKIPEEEVVRLFERVPFLNGGLFECLDKTKRMDGVAKAYYYDGFSRSGERFKNGSYKYRATVPNALFFDEDRGLLPLFKRYNFTIEENSPSDVQVALDPELLGKVFENLLGVLNEETSETARKESGSFYTPREIVDYMVVESLKAHLEHACPKIGKGELEKLFADEAELGLTQAEREELIRAIYHCKILDPACGSGAFPVGVLQRLVQALRRLDPANESWQRVITNEATKKFKAALEGAGEELKARTAEIQRTFEEQKSHPDYTRKLYLIEHCIHGVDLQPIAMMICKLRFFISLVCEQEPNGDKACNYGILPLPNLETNLVAANTLIAKHREEQLSLAEELVAKTRGQLLAVRETHFAARTASKKEALRTQDEALRQELSGLLAEAGLYSKTDAQQLAEWDPYDQNSSAGFFDPEWMFGTREFDVVLGNPPYIQLQKDDGKLAKLYQGEGYKVFIRTGDIYCLFYERALGLLKAGAHACFITSNKWMLAGYGEKLRAFLAAANPRLLIDFGGVQVFDSATVDTNILLYQKAGNQKRAAACTVKGVRKLQSFKLDTYARANSSPQAFTGSAAWVIMSKTEQSIKRKIEAAGVPLKDWDVSINYGIKTGYNEAFIVDSATREQILAACKSKGERERTEKLIRKVLRGRDIKRYGYEWAGLWLINTHNGVKEKGIPRIDINAKDYPALKAYLDGFGLKLSKRQDQGGTPYNLRNCAYLQDFDKPKIVWIELTDESKFAYSDDGTVPLNTAFFMVGEHIEYILGVINSALIHWYYLKSLGARSGAGCNRWLKYTVECIPIPLAPAAAQEQIAALVRRVIAAKQAGKDTADTEREVDRLVCDLYGLTAEERETIGFVEIK